MGKIEFGFVAVAFNKVRVGDKSEGYHVADRSAHLSTLALWEPFWMMRLR